MSDTHQPNLTARQREILSLIDCGADVAAIADELDLSPNTVKDKIKELRMKLSPPVRMVELPALARAAGIEIDPCDDEWEAPLDDEAAIA